VVLLLRDDAFYPYYQLPGTKDFMRTEDGTPITVGDIVPDHEQTVILWAKDVEIAGHSFTDVKRAVRATADDVNTVRYRFPLPQYLQSKLLGRAFNLVLLLLMVAVIGAVVVLPLLKMVF
jgi:hypothetical protein